MAAEGADAARLSARRASNSLGATALECEGRADAAEEAAADAAEDLLARRIDALIVRQSRDPSRRGSHSWAAPIGSQADGQLLANVAPTQGLEAAPFASHAHAHAHAEALARALMDAHAEGSERARRSLASRRKRVGTPPRARSPLPADAPDSAATAPGGRRARAASVVSVVSGARSMSARAPLLSVPPPVPWGVHPEQCVTRAQAHMRGARRSSAVDIAMRVSLGLPAHR